jgi:hypothetical protein
MRGHVGAVLTSGLAAVALALALLQIVVLANSHPGRSAAEARAPIAPPSRYSVPGGRSGIPWLPFDGEKQPPADPKSREGRSPGMKPQEEHRAPPPSRQRGVNPPSFGPRPARRAAA